MAKRRKEGSEAEEQLDFQIPKFDEEAFIKRERRNIKTLFISFLFGLLLSVLCFGFWVLLEGSFLRWELVLLVGVVNSIWIKYVFLKLNIDITDFGRKGWLTSYAVYFMTWLLVLTVLVNPPFYDGEAPRVEVAVLPAMQEPGGTILFAASIVDNVGVTKAGINFTITDPTGSVITPEFLYEDTIFRYTFEDPREQNGTFLYNYTFVVSDVNNKKTTIIGSFTYSPDALDIISSRSTGIMSGDAITIKADERISKNNFRVFYRIENGSDINVDRKATNDKEKYETTAEFKGWMPNTTVSVQVFAETRYYFLNNPEKFSNTIRDTEEYQFSTANDPNIGTEDPLVEWNVSLKPDAQLPNTLSYIVPYPYSIGSTPGFEMVIFVIAIIAVVFLFKRKKKVNTT